MKLKAMANHNLNRKKRKTINKIQISVNAGTIKDGVINTIVRTTAVNITTQSSVFSFL
jgi:hypothetical protein